MHYSAKRGIEIACCLSVCPSVCNVGGSGPYRLEILKIIAQTISPTLALRSPKAFHLLQGNMGTFWETSGGVGKSNVLEYKRGNISET